MKATLFLLLLVIIGYTPAAGAAPVDPADGELGANLIDAAAVYFCVLDYTGRGARLIVKEQWFWAKGSHAPLAPGAIAGETRTLFLDEKPDAAVVFVFPPSSARKEPLKISYIFGGRVRSFDLPVAELAKLIKTHARNGLTRR